MSVGAYVSAEENIRMKISEMKILEEFKEGDDKKFEIFYADFMNLAIQMTQRKYRSQTISTPVQNKKLDYLKGMSNYACLNESAMKSKIEAEHEKDKMITRKSIREKSRSHTITIGGPVQNEKSIKSKIDPDEDIIRMKKLIRERTQSQTNRSVQSKDFKLLPGYLKNVAKNIWHEIPIEQPKKISEEKELNISQQNIQKTRLHIGIRLLKGLKN